MLRMRFGSFVWPNNPRTYTISCKRQTAVHKVPMGGFVVQDLGRTATVMKGEGEFFGANAYEYVSGIAGGFSEGRARDAGTPGLADGRRVFDGAGADAGAARRLCSLPVHVLRGTGARQRKRRAMKR